MNTDRAALTLHPNPDRQALRELKALLEAKRDDIAHLDLEIEELHTSLSNFESRYQLELQEEQFDLERIGRLQRETERWSEAIKRTTPTPRSAPERAEELEKAHQRARADSAKARPKKPDTSSDHKKQETEYCNDEAPEPAEAAQSAQQPEPQETLKSLYRALARKYHPDLARTEEERIQSSRLMAQVNQLYREGDAARLAAMAEQAKGGEIEDDDRPLEEQLSELRTRAEWFEQVFDNLCSEREELELTPTCKLMRDFEQAATAGTDLFSRLRKDLRRRATEALAHIGEGLSLLEQDVAEFNRAAKLVRIPRGDRSLAVFDPFADKSLIQAGLDALELPPENRLTREVVEDLKAIGTDEPAALSLILLAYVSELTPLPIKGIEGREEIAFRLAALHKIDDSVLLERVLLEANAYVTYGVKRATEKLVHVGLRFVSSEVRDSVTHALKHPAIRRAFRDVLGVLGEYRPCPGCHKENFAVPLFRLKGLDNLRALVCPECGAAYEKYWMPKGKDVQALLNAAYREFELVDEWVVGLGRTSIALQLVPMEVDTMTIGALKKRVFHDVFKRNGVDCKLSDLTLCQGTKRLPEKTRLATLPEKRLAAKLKESCTVTLQDAVEVIRHAIRTRFTR